MFGLAPAAISASFVIADLSATLGVSQLIAVAICISPLFR